MLGIFKSTMEERVKRCKRAAIIFPIAMIVIIICNMSNSKMSSAFFTYCGALLISSYMIAGFPHAWNLVRSMLLADRAYDEVTGQYYTPNRNVGITAALYAIALTTGLFLGPILLTIDIIYIVIPKILNRNK